MINKISFFFFLILFSFTLPAQEVSFSIIESDDDRTILRVDFPDISTAEVIVEGEIMQKITIPGTFPEYHSGSPEVLFATRSIMIPENSTPEIEILTTSSKIITDFRLAPSRGKILRRVNRDSIPFIKGANYNENRYFPEKAIDIRSTYILRDFHGASIICAPYRYNPITEELELFSSITFIVHHPINNIPKTTQANPTDSKNNKKTIANEFAPIYQSHFINYKTEKSSSIEENGEMLIITPSTFIEALQPFIEWKTSIGIPVTVTTTNSIGRTSSKIKEYIRQFYNTHNLVYVLFVGDHDGVNPYYVGGAISDNFYAEVAGNDEYPDLILGRMSAQTVEDLEIQIKKSISYEKAPPATMHFPVYCGIASDERSYVTGSYDFEHIREINDLLTSYTYQTGYEMFDGYQEGLDRPGNPTATILANALEEGVGLINYCGHGDWNCFGTTHFSNTHIQNLTNVDKLPVIISVACLNGEYAGKTCFAEHWLRASKDGEPTGAVATLMSTIEQAWDVPMYGQMQMNKIITENISGNNKRSFGGIVFDGLISMTEAHHDLETYRTWLIFGDPSLKIRTASPSWISLTHDRIIEVDEKDIDKNNVVIQGDVDGTNVVLSMENSIIAKGIIQDHSVTFPLSLFSQYDTVNITVTGTLFNYIPYQEQIKIIVNNKRGTDISTPYDASEVSISPNPFSNSLRIEWPAIENGEVRILLYDIHGRKLQDIRSKNQSILIDTQNYTSGMYLLQITDSKGTISNFKLIKQ